MANAPISPQGMDSPEPMLQLDQYLFKGNYEDIVGTTMVFEQDKGAYGVKLIHYITNVCL